MNYLESNTYQAMAKELRERLGGRPYSLGLDLGVGSIGIAAVALESDQEGRLFPTDIVYANSRVFTPSEGASDRRKARGLRNSYRHKSNRLKKTWKILSEKGLMLPYSEETTDNSGTLRFSEDVLRKSPYDIRYRGLKEEITLEELGYALYHIANHRGSSSIRSFLDSEQSEEEEKEKEKVRLTESMVSQSGVKTFIEVLWEYNNNNGFKKFRNSKRSSAVVPIPTRDIIEKEVDILLDTQKQYHPELSSQYIDRIKESIFYENEQIVPEPGMCPYFPDEVKLPSASFLNEERRLWESLINVRIVRSTKTLQGLTRIHKLALGDGEIEILFEVLRTGKDLSPKEIKKLLPQYSSCDIVLPGTQKKPIIKGFRFKSLENKYYWEKLNSTQKEKFISLFVNIPDDKTLCSRFVSDLGLTEEEAMDAVRTVSLVSGYAPVGRSAMEIILDRIKSERLTYQEAEKACVEDGSLVDISHKVMYDRLPYYGCVLTSVTQGLAGKAWHSSFSDKITKPGFIKPQTNLDEEKYGRIANPVVHQTLNELRKLMNELMDIYGYKPEEITVELARELKIGKSKREEVEKENRSRNLRNQRIYDNYCKNNNLSYGFVKKFRIWEDQGKKCPYCLNTISVHDIVSGSCDIEHILPSEDTGDSSELNLVVAHNTCNGTKGKRTPYAAFGGDTELWRKIELNLDSTEGMKKRKERFLMSDDEYETYLKNKGFNSRSISDTAYVARVACEYLQSLFPPEEKYSERYVRTIRGGETALLRSAWNLNGITSAIGEMHYPDPKLSKETDKKSREDIRHHALDAIVAAYYTLSARQLIETESAKETDVSVIKKRLPIPRYFSKNRSFSTKEERENFRSYIENFILFYTFGSRKIDHARNGRITQDTQYSILASYENKCILFTKKKINEMDANSLRGNRSGSVEYDLSLCSEPTWLNTEQKKIFNSMKKKNQHLFSAISNMMEEARVSLEADNQKLKDSGKTVKEITEKLVLKRALSMVGGTYYSVTNKMLPKLFVLKKNNQPVSAYITEDNYCIDFYRKEDGSLGFEIIRKINAISNTFIPKYKKNGYKLFERIYGKDILEMDFTERYPGADKGLFCRSIKAPNAPEGRTFVVMSTYTESNNNKSFQIRYDSMFHSKSEKVGTISGSKFASNKVRKVVISPAGLVVYRSPIIE